MDFTAKYTTASKITADKTGVEAKKITLTEEGYAQTEATYKLIAQIEKTRLSLN